MHPTRDDLVQVLLPQFYHAAQQTRCETGFWNLETEIVDSLYRVSNGHNGVIRHAVPHLVNRIADKHRVTCWATREYVSFSLVEIL